MTRSRIPRVPLWLRWVISISVAVTILIVIVRFVSTHNNDQPAPANPAALAQANEEGAIIVRQDQAPHVERLKAGVKAAAGIEAAVRAFVAAQIARGIVDGPIGRTACIPLKQHGSAAAQPFRCAVIAGSVGYPFLGVVDVRARRITYCKQDAPPVPSENIPVSRRCTA